MRKPLLCLGISLLIAVSCRQENSIDERPLDRPSNFTLTDPTSRQNLENGDLISVQRIVSLSLDELRERLSGLAEPQFPIHLYRIVYRTSDLNGKAVDASGMIALPAERRDVYPLIALQHGTITSQVDAPSTSPRQGILEASQGFMVAAQDYIGFGTATTTAHPYLIPEAYVQSGLDMIRATREFAAQNKMLVPVFFLAGYSEGGYASLAIQQAIETQDHLKEEFLSPAFRLLASAPAAGPYNLSLTAVRSLNQEQVNPVNLLKVIKSYRHWYPEAELQYNDFFQLDTFAVDDAQGLEEKIEKDLLSGRWRVMQLLQMITPVTNQLVEENYLQRIRSIDFDKAYETQNPEADDTGLIPLLDDNNLVRDWAPRIPTRLYQCSQDEVVPAVVAQATAEVFQTIDPETQVRAVIIDDPRFGHGNCPAVISPIEWFASFLANPT
ncbi:MAG: hypothetical protein ACOH5I_13505 [Oligoflexus sp.]